MKKHHYILIGITIISVSYLATKNSISQPRSTAYCLLPNNSKLKLSKDSCHIDNIITKLSSTQLNDMGPKTETKIIVPKGNRFKVFFDDTSFVTLKEETILSLFLGDKSSRNHNVKIEGVGYFCLKGDTSIKHFIIQAGDIKVLASGGRVGISSVKNDSCAIFAYSAKVDLNTPAGSIQNYGPQKGLKVTKNRIMTVMEVEDGVPAWAIDDFEVTAPFVNVLNYVEQRYNIRAEVKNTQILSHPVHIKATGTLSLSMFCEVVKNATGFNYRIDKDAVYFFDGGTL